ncbi:uncharacterized protein IUM83_05622 [Phytophthora cinnamomi]|uniref:uncharacterized protein n=1 Tax=Phytophthora cinnamomi TaxID=4785 RepID=UPI00355A6564|nr:hypothetical protein IUM83_05622 [Phytophthora cinnamomi]
MVDLDRAIQARDASDREADRFRAEFAELQTTASCSEDTVNALTQQIRGIESQRRALAQGLTVSYQEHEDLLREHAIARRQLAMVSAVAGASPAAVEETLDPAYLLSLLRNAPLTPASQQPAGDTPDPHRPDPESRIGTSGSTSSRVENAPSDPDLEKESGSRRRADLAASKRARAEGVSSDPGPSPPAKRRIFPTAPERDDAFVDLTSGGQIADDTGIGDENPDEDPDEEKKAREDSTTSVEEEDEVTAAVTSERFEAQTLEALSQSRSTERRRQHASPLRRSTTSGTRAPRRG